MISGAGGRNSGPRFVFPASDSRWFFAGPDYGRMFAVFLG
jgi:hypothetical protein